MRDLIKSMVNVSVAMPLFAMKQARDLWRSKGAAASLAGDLDSVTAAVSGRLSGAAREVYEKGDRLQRTMLGGEQDAQDKAVKAEPARSAEGRAAEPGVRQAPVRSGSLDTRTIVVLGEGLAAGFGDFSLAEEFQKDSFAAQLAAQLGREFRQPYLESPGIGDAPGFPRLPVIVPALMQTTALTSFPPAVAPHNLSVPGFRVADAAGLRPALPVVHQADARQTLANLILGLPDLLDGSKKKLPSQLERAVSLEPTFALVELGFHEVLEAAVAGRAVDLPDRASFRSGYQKLVSELGAGGAKLLLLTIPDPVHTAYFSSVTSAAANLKVEPAVLIKTYALAPDDVISVPGLVEMGFQLLADAVAPLPSGGVHRAAVAAEISKGVAGLNAEIRAIAEQHGCEVFDLAGLIEKVAGQGVEAGGRRLSADFLGGFYLLNGYYPGATGHAVIANAIIDQLNASFGASFPPIELATVLPRDPAAACRAAAGPVLKGKDFKSVAGKGVTEVAGGRSGAASAATKRTKKAPARSAPKPGARLTLPPGLEQTLPVSSAASYFGDAIRAANCRNEDERMFGSGRELLFGGLCMVDSHLSGEIRIKFQEPKDDVARFEVFHGHLEGENGTLAAPQFFKLPALRNEVRDDDTLVSSGELELETGEVRNLKYAVRFGNTALMALVRVNPKLPNVPIEFPGLYGSAWARFEQREDGLLDYSFYGTTFIPLGGAMEGDPIRFPLPFCSPTLEFASIPAPGTSLHPHLHITTKEPEEVDASLVPEIPTDTLREYTLFTRNTSFGDKFTLHSPELLGDPTGRSHLLGRLQVQFGHPSGDSVPIAVSFLNPGGMLGEAAPSPLADEFPGRLPPSPVGHNEFLRFATRSYFLDALTCIDDPFDVSVGNVSRTSGRLLGELLHRALIGQNLFYALLRVEPRTPKSSFHFRGPAHFEKGKDGRSVFRFFGQVNVPYPEGFLFPSPDMATGVPVGADSELDPFYWVQAMEHERKSEAVAGGGADDLLSSANERFSYKYEICGDPAHKKPSFEYTNHTLGGVFKLKSLAWVSFVNSRGEKGEPGACDTLSFAGFGTWSRDGETALHLVCAQICEAKPLPYVSIQIDGGRVSNVNTKPEKLEDVRP